MKNRLDDIAKRLEQFGGKWWGMLILVSIPLFMVLWPVLIGGQIFSAPESDRFQQAFYFYQDAILKGDSFFLNPYVFSGFPTFVSLSGGFLNPLVYLAMHFFSVAAVYHWLNFFYLMAAAFLMAIFLKRIGASFWAQYIAALTFVFSQWSQIHDITVNCNFFLLPLIFLLLWEFKNKRGWKAGAILTLGAAAIGITWFSSFWHFLIEIIFVAGLFSLFLGLVDWWRDQKETGDKAWTVFKLSWRKYIKVPLGYLVMILGSMIIGVWQLVPTWVFLTQSVRTEQFTNWEAVQGGVHIYDVMGLFLPYFKYPLAPLSSYLVDYMGVLSLFLFIAVFSLKLKFWRKTNGSLIFFFSFLSLLGLSFAFNRTPFFWLLHHLPPFTYLHEISRWMLVSSFAVAFLAGLGLDYILANFDYLKQSRLLKIVAHLLKWINIFLISLFLIITVVSRLFKNLILQLSNDYFDKFIYPRTGHLPLDYYYGYIAKIFNDFVSACDLFNPKVFISLLFVISAYGFMRLYLFGRLPTARFAPLAALLITLNFVLVFSVNNNVVPVSSLNRAAQTVNFLRHQPEGKIFSFMRFLAPIKLGQESSSEEESILKSELIFSNKNVPLKLASVDIEGDPMANKSMANLITYIGGAASLEKAETLESLHLPIEDKVKIFESRKPVIDFLGVRYLLSTAAVDENIFPKIFETEATDKKIPVFIYEDKEARPLYYFTDEKWLAGMSESTTAEDLNNKLKESNTKVTQEGIRLLDRKNNSLIVRTDTQKAQCLVFSQNNVPGWAVYIDNQEALLYNIGTVFMGVEVPAGHHLVVFKYSYWNIWRYFLSGLSI